MESDDVDHAESGRRIAESGDPKYVFGEVERGFIGLYDVTGTPGNPRVIEFTTHLGEGHTTHVLPWVWPDHVTWRDEHESRPGVAIAWAETHGPLDQEFPAPSQKRLFGESETLGTKPTRPAGGVKLHDVVSTARRRDAERIVRDLVPWAFRRRSTTS